MKGGFNFDALKAAASSFVHSAASTAKDLSKAVAQEVVGAKCLLDYTLQGQVASAGPGCLWKVYQARAKKEGKYAAACGWLAGRAVPWWVGLAPGPPGQLCGTATHRVQNVSHYRAPCGGAAATGHSRRALPDQHAQSSPASQQPASQPPAWQPAWGPPCCPAKLRRRPGSAGAPYPLVSAWILDKRALQDDQHGGGGRGSSKRLEAFLEQCRRDVQVAVAAGVELYCEARLR
jgi:hypothetical protein